MPILVGEYTRVLVQGITGRQGSLHTLEMKKYGTKVVAGVTPGKGGSTVHGVPVYDSVYEALEEHPEINTSIVFVPAPYAPDAVYEAVDSHIPLVVVITEHIPAHETLKMIEYAKCRGTLIVGPNTPGIISPGITKVGIMPGQYFSPGNIGIVSRSGTLTYEVSAQLKEKGLGVSTAIGIGGDPVNGVDFIEAYEMFLRDPATQKIVLVGEIGGSKEEKFAEYYRSLPPEKRKPVVAYIAGRSAPPGKKMGHAGAIIYGKTGSYEAKAHALGEAGIKVAERVVDIPGLLEG